MTQLVYRFSVIVILNAACVSLLGCSAPVTIAPGVTAAKTDAAIAALLTPPRPRHVRNASSQPAAMTPAEALADKIDEANALRRKQIQGLADSVRALIIGLAGAGTGLAGVWRFVAWLRAPALADKMGVEK